jgi:hypothetical protein
MTICLVSDKIINKLIDNNTLVSSATASKIASLVFSNDIYEVLVCYQMN